MSSYLLEINKIELYAFHGVFPAEQELGQPFSISAKIEVNKSENLDSCTLDSVLSYVKVYDIIKASFTEKSYLLLENIGQIILDRLAIFQQIKKVELQILKTKPPIPAQIESIGIVLSQVYE